MTKRSVCTVMATLLVACSGGERQVAGPGEPGGGPSTATLQVSVGVADADSELADRLGWTSGVPGAEVQLLRNGSATWQVAETDADGVATFENVLKSRYRIFAGRTLSSAEAVGEPIRAFGDGMTFDVTSVGDVPVELRMLADRTDGLVISEVSTWSPPPAETSGTYTAARYLELHNNSSQTLFLDGMLLGQSVWTRESLPTPCAASLQARSDPSGVYARRIIQFPGSGGEYPIQPGETVLVAGIAIDHTPVHPQLFDLSDARFELGQTAGADNPAVPNMLDVGFDPFVETTGGQPGVVLSASNAVFLAEPLDPQSLPFEYRDGNGRGWVRIPAASLVDVMVPETLWPDFDQQQGVPCIPAIHPSFDRYEGGFLETGLETTTARLTYQRVLLRMEGGRAILQDANTSAVDIEMRPPTPGTLPN